MNEKEKKLLNLLQKEFPLSPFPFKILGEKVNLSEKEVLSFLKTLQEKGILRHLGASVNSKKLGYYTLLCATHIPDNKLYIAETIAKLKEVTHAYLRKHYLNFWFTLITPSEEKAKELIKSLESSFSIKIKSFPSIKSFKVKAVFEI